YLLSSGTTSKLNLLVNKLHEFLAHSAVEDSNDTPNEDHDGNMKTNNLWKNLSIILVILFQCLHRKPSVVIKHSGLDESGDSNDSMDVEIFNVNGELDITRLPKGTAVVRPEPVENGRDDFRGPEFHSRKQTKNALKKNLLIWMYKTVGTSY
uniref:DNA helicase n=1 Tax=Periophthalmus magnuspinnatus TaxID=409849 RepID=A0A3B4A3P8_9GOBI